jgi:hypothetical protein
MQADFIAFMRAEIDATGHFGGWWPDTLVFRPDHRGPFELFARATSRAYFDKIKILFGIDKPQDLEELFEKYGNRSRALPQFGYHSVNPSELLGYAKLATVA